MDFHLLQSWLDLPSGPWPPDHYTLLGFPRGRVESSAVEPRVMERMDLLRRHQLRHPEVVTEGMNRLAQALITLTDPVGKSAYDAELGVPSPLPTGLRPPPATVVPKPTAAGRAGPVVVAIPVLDDDLFTDDIGVAGPPDASDMTQVIVLPSPGGRALPYEVLGEAALSLDEEPLESLPVAEIIVEQPAAPVVLPALTRRGVYARLALLRKARRAWSRLGSVLGDPQDPLDRPGRVLLLLESIRAVRPLLPALRDLVGQVGQPGGVVAAVIAQALVLDTIRRLLPDQRQVLAIDWRRGQVEMEREYARLRRLTATAREHRRSATEAPRFLRLLRRTPELMLAMLALVVVLIAVVRWLAGG